MVIASVVQRLQKTQLGKSLTQKLKASHHQDQTGNEEEPTEPPATPPVSATTFSVVEIDHRHLQQPLLSDFAEYGESAMELVSLHKN